MNCFASSIKIQTCPTVVMATAETCFWLLAEEEEGGVGGSAGQELSLTSVTELTSGQEVTVPRVIRASGVRARCCHGCLEAAVASC